MTGAAARRGRLLVFLCSLLCSLASLTASPLAPRDPVHCSGRTTFADPDRVVWTFWHHARNMPPLVAEMVHSWKVWSPDHEVVLLTESNLRCFLPDNDFAMFRKLPALRSDLVRLSVLKEYGGTWIDATTLLTEPLPGTPLPVFEGIYTATWSSQPRDFPESWFMRAAKGSELVSRWLVPLQAVTMANGPQIAGLAKSFIFTPNSTAAYHSIADTIGGTSVYWSEYLVIYTAYTWLYQNDAEFRSIVLASPSHAAEEVGYLLPWHLHWNMSQVNAVMSAAPLSDPMHERLLSSKLIKLSTSNLAVGVELAAHQSYTFLGHCLRKVRNDVGLDRSTFQLVVVRYAEDLAWTAPYRGLRVLYEKDSTLVQQQPKGFESDQVHWIENTGVECAGFLRYIIANYDSLPQFVGFSQGELSPAHAWVRSDYGPRMFLAMLAEARAGGGCSRPVTVDDHLSNADFGLRFDPRHPRDAHYQTWPPSLFPDFAAWLAFHGWLPSAGSKLYVYPSAYMVISRGRIHSSSKAAYTRLLETVAHSTRPPEAHFLERSWHYVFHCPVPL